MNAASGAPIHTLHKFLHGLSEVRVWFKRKKYSGIATETCFYCGQALRAIYMMFLFDAGPLTVNSVKLALCSNYCITEKAISPTTCHVYTAWTNH